jgi:3-oxoacyl-[acyl-carrier protein] reductase
MKSPSLKKREYDLRCPNDKLSGYRALVTGATGGIGEAIAAALIDAGIKVIASGQNADKLAELKRRFPDLVIEQADFRNPDAITKLAQKALKHHDGLDILVNNAGIGINGNVVQMDPSDFESMLDINLKAPFILSKIIGQSMALAGHGFIINIGSGASFTPIAGMAGYCATKYGLLGFSESLALELRDFGVKVSIIMPGSTATGFGGGDSESRLKSKPGILLPSDVADSVMYLLNQSERAWTSQLNLRPLNPNKKPII